MNILEVTDLPLKDSWPALFLDWGQYPSWNFICMHFPIDCLFCHTRHQRLSKDCLRISLGLILGSRTGLCPIVSSLRSKAINTGKYQFNFSRLYYLHLYLCFPNTSAKEVSAVRQVKRISDLQVGLVWLIGKG